MRAETPSFDLETALRRRLDALEHALDAGRRAGLEEYGEITEVGAGVVQAAGLPRVRSEELVTLGGGPRGLVLDLRPDSIGIAVLDDPGDLSAGDPVHRTGRVLDVPVGRSLLGRVVDGLGRPLDGRGGLAGTDRWPVERDAPAIMDRAPVTVPLETGIKVVDALIPIGRGQRQLLVGDRQTGKTTLALHSIIAQRDRDVACVYCAIGQRASAIARTVELLRNHGALEHTVVVATTEEDQPGMRYVAAYAAMSMAERLMADGGDALIVLDDLTRHARAYRELSLLLRRPPGREAYPGDIFFIHSRLLERSTHLREERGGGSTTAMAIVETEAQNISAYIPTNLISITDGQIYFSPSLFQKGLLPAVDVGRSVSRVGGKTQHRAYRSVAGSLRLAYSQFEELESFSRFATRLDEETRRTLEHGRRVREVLRQGQYEVIPIPEQLALLLAVEEGLLDGEPVEAVPDLAAAIRRRYRQRHAELGRRIRSGEPLDEETRNALLDSARAAVEARSGVDGEGEA